MLLRPYLLTAALLLVAAFCTFRVIVRRDYLRRGRLTLVSYSLQLLIWGWFFGLPYLYNPADWVWFWTYEPPLGTGLRAIAVFCIVLGLALLVLAMTQLGLDRSVGRKVNALRGSGVYGVTRNPQIVGGAPLIIGLALLWPSWYAAGWVLLFVVLAHLMVRTEEEHLRALHGQDYERYCNQVPRYLRLPRRS